MADFKIYQNGSKDGHYYIAEDTHEQNLSYSELYHYGVKGMRWGVRKDQVKARLSKSFNDARYSKPVQKAANTKVGKAAKKSLYTTFDVKNFDDLVVKVGKMAKSPKGIAAIAAIAVLPDPLIWAGMAAYASVKNSGVLNRRLKHEDACMDELKHYGILGMKWGVRRTPEQLGHVKKGTKMYRVTPNPNEKEEGSTYVTYLRPDRDMYRGAFNKQGGFAKYYNIDPKSPMYESIYTNKEDLKVATYDVQKEVTNKIMRRDKEKLLKDLSRSAAQDKIDSFNLMADYYKILRQKYPERSIADESQLRSMYMRGTKNNKEYVQKVIQEFKDMTPDELYRVASSRFGKNQLIKESVISELKKKGYNAMIDQASVGGGSRNIEGQAPMIIFDRGEILEKRSSNKISDYTRDVASDNYMNWYNWVNSSEKRKQNW